MTGAIAFAYSSDTTVDGVNTSGMGVGGANIDFAVSEAVEGLGTVSGGLGFAAASGKGSAVTGRDVTLAVKLSSGTGVKFYSGQGASYLAGGLASAGSAFDIGLDGYLIGSSSYADELSVSIPVMAGVTVGLAHAEPGVSGGGTGAAAAAGGAVQRYNTLSLGYSAGALALNAGYRTYDYQIADTTTSASSKNRFGASYDLGVVKLGAGMDQTSYTAGNTYTETLAGLTIPMGALTLGAQLGQVATSGYTTNYTFSGSLVGANYTFSKRTYATFQYANWSGAFKGSTAVATTGTQNASALYATIYNTF